MPALPQFPPWLKPADPAAHLLEGFKAGAQISEANARLAESARTADIGFSLDQQRLQEQSRKEQQQVEVQRAYHQQTTELKQQQLQQAKEVNDARIQQLLAQQTAKKQYETDYQTLVDSGMDSGAAAIKAGIKNAVGMGLSGQGIAALAKSQLAEKPEGLETQQQNGETFQKRNGKWYHIPNMKPTTDTITETIPAVAPTDAVPAQEASKGFLGFGGNPAIPASPANPGHGEQKITRHVPVNLMDSYNASVKAKTATGTTPGTSAPKGKRVKVVGPKGQKGTIIEGDSLPDGWKLAGEEKPTDVGASP